MTCWTFPVFCHKIFDYTVKYHNVYTNDYILHYYIIIVIILNGRLDKLDLDIIGKIVSRFLFFMWMISPENLTI